ncbi:MAG: DUF4157 domain-containing protein [Kofleriaceae bacterium]
MRNLRAGSNDDEHGTETTGASPGKRTRTESVQRKAASTAAPAAPAASAPTPAGPDRAVDDPFDFSFGGTVQRRAGAGAPDDPAQVQQVAAAGLGSGGALPYQAELERGFGVELSSVRAHTDAGAAQASRAIGAEAYTMGADIAFASPAPSRELVAHEVAHVIQQRSGAGPASGVGTAGDSFEREADAAAAVVASGGHSELASGYGQAGGGGGALQRQVVQKYESAEHAMLGDGMTYPVVLSEMELPNHAHATRGELIAFGDFYGSAEDLAQAPREETEALIGIIRWEGIWTLAGRQAQQGTATGDDPHRTSLATAAEPDDTGWHGGDAARHGTRDLVTWASPAFDALVAGVKLRDRAQAIHAQFTPSWEFFGMNVPMTTFSHGALTIHHMRATLGRRRFRNANNTLGSPRTDELPATTDPRTADPAGLGGDYFDLASNNLSHFAVTNWATWENFHAQTCARVAASPGDATVQTNAVIEDSMGCHYLTDIYASGHAVDKQALMTEATSMMVDMSQRQGLSEAGDNRHDVVGDMLTESLQLAFRDDRVYEGWRQGCNNAFDQGLVRYDELELMLTIPRGTQWADGPLPSVVGNLVATLMGMPWRNNQPNDTPGGDRPGGGRPSGGESFGPGNQPEGEGDYHLGVGNLAALTAHNALNAIGFTAKNGRGDEWRMQGDSHLTAETQAMAQHAIDESTRQVRAGTSDPAAVRQWTPQFVKMDPAWAVQYYRERQAAGVEYDPTLYADVMAKVAALSTYQPMTDGATVSGPLRELCSAMMRLEFVAPPGQYQALLDAEGRRAQEGHGDGTASMTNTGINVSFLRQFLIENLPRMVPVAYAAASPGDLSTAALEAYRPRDAGGNILPTGANDFRWTGSRVDFRVNVTGCNPGQTYTLGIQVHDQDAGLDYLPSGQLEDAPAGRNDDEVYGRSGVDAQAMWPLTITVPPAPATDPNGSIYADATWTLAGRGDIDHGEHYLRVFADAACTMVIGRSTSRDSGETSNPAPLDPSPRATGPDRTAVTAYNAVGVDRNAFAWDGNSVRFRLLHNAPPGAPAAPVRAWVKQFDKDSGYDFDTEGRELPTEFFEPRDDDPLIGGPTLVTAEREVVEGARVSAQVVLPTVDNPGDTYVIVYGDAGCTRPLARSHVQGTNRGTVRNATPPTPATAVSGLSWTGNTLSFAVTPASAPRVWVKLFDKDSGYDYDTHGRLLAGARDEDEQYGGVVTVEVTGGRATTTASGDAAHEDTYAIVYADAGCAVPLARSNARG